MRAVHVHMRRCGKVQHDQLGRRAFSAHPVHNGVPHVIHVEVDEARLRPEDQDAGNELIARMPFPV